MNYTRKACLVAATALSLSFGLTACGEEAPAAKDAWNKAQDRVGTYKSVSMKLNGTSEGKPVELTVNGATDDKTLDVKGKMDGGNVELIKVDGKQYMKGDKAYYQSLSSKSSSSSMSNAYTSKMENKWISFPSSASSSSDGMFKDIIKKLRDDSQDSNKKLLSDKATVTEDKVDGRDAWKISSEDKKTNVWVTKDDNFDLIKIQGDNFSKSSGATGKVNSATFSDYNKDFKITAPSDAKSMTDILMGK